MEGFPNSDDFLFELYSEEIPASYQKRMIEESREVFLRSFQHEKLIFSHLETGGTPRRFYLFIKNLNRYQQKSEEIIKGPPKKVCFNENNEYTPALLGFAKKVEVNPNEIFFTKDDEKKIEYASVKIQSGGKESIEIIARELTLYLTKYRFPRSMRWNNHDITYARPYYFWFALYGSSSIDFTQWSSSDIWKIAKKSLKIKGHFILNDSMLTINRAENYFEALKNIKIIVHSEQRKDAIIEKLKEKAALHNLDVIINNDLINEVNFLVEKPEIITAQFPDRYLNLPEIVIISEMQEHQKYFPAREKNGKLSNRFFIVTNGDPELGEKNISSGNEKVLNARLADGKFFYENDRKIPLIDRVNDLKSVLFMEGMGSLFDKKERLKKIVEIISKKIKWNQKKPERNEIERTSDLLKADLITQMVFEFEQLQGEMGRIYALEDGEDSQIAEAILEHYLPRHQDDKFPETTLGILFSLSEKIDNIFSGFATGKQPKASKDPLGLRRSALYFIEILLENKIFLNVFSLLSELSHYYPTFDINELWTFFQNRAVSIFESKDFKIEYIRAGLYITENEDFYHQYLKLKALKDLQHDRHFEDLMAAFKRMVNIIHKNKIEENIDILVEQNLLVEKEEQNLYNFYLNLKKQVDESNHYESETQYAALFQFISDSKTIIDNFFDHIMVMDEKQDIRRNRTSLLFLIVSSINQILNLNELK